MPGQTYCCLQIPAERSSGLFCPSRLYTRSSTTCPAPAADPTSCAQADFRKNQSCTSPSSGAARVAHQHRDHTTHDSCGHPVPVPRDTADPASQAHTVHRHNSADFTEALGQFLAAVDPLCATTPHCPLITPRIQSWELVEAGGARWEAA